MTKVYVMMSHQMRPIKIGISKDCKNRLQSVNTHNPYKHKIYYVTSPLSEDMARKVEGVVFSKLCRSRLNGEWFSVSPSEGKTAIIEALAVGHDPPT